MTERRAAARWMPPALAGIASVVLGVGLGELASAAVAPSSGPFVAVGSLLIDLAPPWAKDTAIALFGTGDKAALLTGVGLVLLGLAVVAGLLEARRAPWGRVLVGVLGAAGVLAAVTRASAGMLAVVPSLVAAAVAVIAMGRLVALGAAPSVASPPIEPSQNAGATGLAPAMSDGSIEQGTTARATEQGTTGRATRADDARATQPDRRRFLTWAGGSAAVGVLAAASGYALRAGSRTVAAVREAIRLPAPTTRAVVPSGAELHVDGLSPVITPNADFYRIDTALAVPEVDPSTWKLHVHGMVAREVTLTWAELLALPLEEHAATLTCVSNEVGGDLIGNATWLGYPIRNLLARAAPSADADMVLSHSIDGFTASTPLPVLQDDRAALLAIGMNGRPLPPEHGFPVRMVVPGLYGYVSATKWVVELEVTRFDRATAYWTDRGWSDHGPVKLSSRIDVPRDGQPVKAGRVTVAGVAWHQHTGVSAVEVQVDDGPWRPADLAAAISPDTWVQWRFDWDATTGSHRLRVRATGADGEVQTAVRRDVVPDGATGLHERVVQVG